MCLHSAHNDTIAVLENFRKWRRSKGAVLGTKKLKMNCCRYSLLACDLWVVGPPPHQKKFSMKKTNYFWNSEGETGYARTGTTSVLSKYVLRICGFLKLSIIKKCTSLAKCLSNFEVLVKSSHFSSKLFYFSAHTTHRKFLKDLLSYYTQHTTTSTILHTMYL